MFMKLWEFIWVSSRYKFGMTWCFAENPLKRLDPLGGVWISSLNFFTQDVKYLELSSNEKEKEEVYLGGAISFVWVNIIVLIVWDEMLRPILLSSLVSFSL